MNIWQTAIDEMLVINHLGTAESAESLEDARIMLDKLIDYEIAMATDPAINGGYMLTKGTN